MLRKSLVERFQRALAQRAVRFIEQRKDLTQIAIFGPAVLLKGERQRRDDFRKQPAKSVPAGVVFFVNDFFFWLGERMRSIATQV